MHQLTRRINGRVVALTATLSAVATNAFAAVAPAQGDFAYSAYTMAVDDVLKGPIGYIISLAFIAFGFVAVVNRQSGGPAVGLPMLLVGGLITQLDAITASVGCVF